MRSERRRSETSEEHRAELLLRRFERIFAFVLVDEAVVVLVRRFERFGQFRDVDFAVFGKEGRFFELRREFFHFFAGQETVAVFIGGFHFVFMLLRNAFRELGDFDFAVFESVAERRSAETRALRAGAESGSAETRALRAGAETGSAETRAGAETGAVFSRREERLPFVAFDETVSVFVGGFHFVFMLLRRLFRELGDFDFAVFERVAEHRAGAAEFRSVFLRRKSVFRLFAFRAAVLSDSEGRGRSQQRGEKNRLFHFVVS